MPLKQRPSIGRKSITATQIACAGMLALGMIAMFLFSRKAPDAGPQDFNHCLRFGGRNRTYEVHVPPNYDGRTPLPVVLNIHGGGGDAAGCRQQTQMDKAADRFGYIAVYPEGTSAMGKFYTWNAGICCAYAVNWKVDDVGFISRLLDELPKQYAVDTRRVYATGMSNGAMMCYRLACELSDRITAICAVSSGQGVEGPRPKRPVPIMHIHGLKDPNAMFAGGIGPNAISKVQHKPIRDVIAWWCEVDNCLKQPVEVVKQSDYIMERYAPPEGEPGAPIVLYMLPEGGHTWPGGVDVTPRLGTGKLIATFDANAAMWDFFRHFSLDAPRQQTMERVGTPTRSAASAGSVQRRQRRQPRTSPRQQQSRGNGAGASAAVEIIEHPALKPRRIPSRSWRDLIKKVWEVDPLLCPYDIPASPRDAHRVTDQRRADHRARSTRHRTNGSTIRCRTMTAGSDVLLVQTAMDRAEADVTNAI